MIQGLIFDLKTCSSDQKSNPETMNPNFFHENDFAYYRVQNKRTNTFIILDFFSRGYCLITDLENFNFTT